MTTTEPGLTGAVAQVAVDVDTEDGSPPGLGIRDEALLGLEVVALTSFVVARPVLASFGRSAEVFIARGADWADIVVFVLALLVVPPLALAALGALAGLGGACVRRAVHALVLAPLLATAVWQLAHYVTDPSGVVGAALCLAAGAGLAVLRLRADWLAAFLRYAALGALVFAAQFLFASPASSIVLGGRHAEIDADVTAAVESAIGDDGPPLVVVTLDGLPTNLLLDGAYDVHASEQITALCPITLCPSHDGRVVPHLLRDARDVWDMQMEGTPVDEMLVPGAFDHRYESFSAWIDEQDFTAGDRPDLFFYHWGDWGIDVARQRHVLQAQASDVLLGKLFERLRDAGTYDDALVVVTADHGYSFEPNTPMRGLSKDNFDDIMWTPLIVKSPGQDEGAVDDVNITTADVLPTIADDLGIDVPWEFDGQPAAEIDRPSTKSIDDWKGSDWRSTDGGPVEVDGAEGLERVLSADAVEGSGPLAVWQRTLYGGLVGTRLDDAMVGAPRV